MNYSNCSETYVYDYPIEEEEEHEHKTYKDVRKSWKSFKEEYNYATGSFKDYEELYKLIDILEHDNDVPEDQRFVKIRYGDDFKWSFITFEELEEQFGEDYDDAYEFIHGIDMEIYEFNDPVFKTRLNICDHIRNLVARYNPKGLSPNPIWKEIHQFLADHEANTSAESTAIQSCS